jgi:hypothetical protein
MGAAAELGLLVGTAVACTALGVARASFYRTRRGRDLSGIPCVSQWLQLVSNYKSVLELNSQLGLGSLP